ncbi:MAG: tyrosine-type recombinase/integrase [Kiritimatiellae bacterium]|nr:tyrosine-type recombinase/integrase [Kiritimatiellia bacterium]
MRDYFDPTIKRYLRRWQTTLRPETIKSKRGLLRRFSTYLRENHPEVRRFSQLQRDPHIEGWIESRLSVSVVTRNWEIHNLRTFFEDLIEWQWRDAPPPALLRAEDIAPEPLHLPRPLSPELDQAVQKAFVEAGTCPAMGLLLMRYTGMRIGEMRALALNAMEPAGPEVFSLRVPPCKTYAERLIPIDERTVELIRRIIAQRAHLLKRRLRPSRRHLMMIGPWGRHLSPATYGVHLKELTAHLDPSEHITSHRLRHTYATELARAGMPVPALMKLMGHKTPKMTMRYVQVAQADVREAYEQALTQLSVIRSVQSSTLPALCVPTMALPQQPESIQLLKLMEAMITGLESHRRDELDPDRSKQLHRFIKRIRKAGYDLKDIL